MGVSDLISQARSQVRNLDVDAFAAELDDPDVVVLDVREPGEAVADGAIPGAVAAPRGMLEFYADPASPYHLPELTQGRRVLVYCKSGGRSALAAATLQGLGYDQVGHLDGGINAWVQANRPTVRP